MANDQTNALEQKSRGNNTARTLTSSAFPAALVVNKFNGGNRDVLELLATLREQATALKIGDMTQVEEMLLNQAVALQSMFCDFATRCKSNTDIDIVQRLGHLAMKAQSNCRATLHTLAEIKNPRQVAFFKQANIAETQQVNNGTAARPHAKKKENMPIKLVAEGPDGSSIMDAGTAPQAGRDDPDVGTLDGVHRANLATGKGRHSS